MPSYGCFNVDSHANILSSIEKTAKVLQKKCDIVLTSSLEQGTH